MNRFTTQEISHPAVEDPNNRLDPHPRSIHSFDRAKVEAFVARERKLRSRIVTTSVSIHKLPSGKFYAQFHAVSTPRPVAKFVKWHRADRPMIREEELTTERKRRERAK